jgi:hypothetical protein
VISPQASIGVSQLKAAIIFKIRQINHCKALLNDIRLQHHLCGIEYLGQENDALRPASPARVA